MKSVYSCMVMFLSDIYVELVEHRRDDKVSVVKAGINRIILIVGY